MRYYSMLISLLIRLICFAPDYSQGFGGKFGVQKDRQDKSAAGWDHVEKVDKHESQKGEIPLKVSKVVFFY